MTLSTTAVNFSLPVDSHNLRHYSYHHHPNNYSTFFSSSSYPIINTSALYDNEAFVSASSTCFEPTSLESVESPVGQALLIVLYSATSVLSLLGNIVVIIVQLYGRESSKNIRKYLLNLAVSDLITGVGSVPFTFTSIVYGHWIFPDLICPAAQFIQLLSVFITSATISIIGAERYIVAIHPVSCACHWFQSHSRHMLLASWICGAAYASIPVSNTYTTVFEVDGTEYRQCNYDNELSELKRSLFAVTNFVLTFTLPLAIMSFSYLAIMRRLKNSEKFITVYTAGQAIAGNGSRTKSSSEVKEVLASDDGCGGIGMATNTKNIGLSLTNANGSTTLAATAAAVVVVPNSSPAALNTRKSVTLMRKSPVNVHRSKIIRMMFIVILLYCICWLPLKAFQFLLNYGFIAHCSQRLTDAI